MPLSLPGGFSPQLLCELSLLYVSDCSLLIRLMLPALNLGRAVSVEHEFLALQLAFVYLHVYVFICVLCTCMSMGTCVCVCVCVNPNLTLNVFLDNFLLI